MSEESKTKAEQQAQTVAVAEAEKAEKTVEKEIKETTARSGATVRKKTSGAKKPAAKKQTGSTAKAKQPAGTTAEKKSASKQGTGKKAASSTQKAGNTKTAAKKRATQSKGKKPEDAATAATEALENAALAGAAAAEKDSKVSGAGQAKKPAAQVASKKRTAKTQKGKSTTAKKTVKSGTKTATVKKKAKPETKKDKAELQSSEKAAAGVPNAAEPENAVGSVQAVPGNPSEEKGGESPEQKKPGEAAQAAVENAPSESKTAVEAEENAKEPTEQADKKEKKKFSLKAFFAKKVVRIAAVVVCLALVAGGIGWWALATTPGWHQAGGTPSYYILGNTHQRAKGFLEIDGVEYAFTDRGNLMKGFGTYAGKTYCADAQGHRLFGRQMVEGTEYYLNPETGEFRTGFCETEAGTIGFSETGFPLYGVARVSGQPYYFDGQGILQKNDGLFEAKRSTYDSLPTGELQTGWQAVNDKTYYFDPESCQMQTGVVTVEDVSYLLGDDGIRCAGRSEVGGNTYLADENGVLQTGWQTLDDGPCYLDPETGCMQFGHADVDGAIYFFDTETGAKVVSAIASDDSGIYDLDADGKALIGWQDIGSKRYHFKADGAADVGYTDIDGNHYYFSERGVMQKGFRKMDGVLYYFGEDGIIQAGAYEYNGASRLFDAEGRVLSGWQTLGGVRYYYADGVKATGNVTIDGEQYNLGSDGILRVGWIGDYYYSSHGYPYTGAQKVDGVLHYFDSTGKMLRGTTAGLYDIDANGVAKKRAVSVGGGSVASCYNWVRANMRYASIPASSYDEMVQYALANHRGACYHYASLLHYVLAQSGIPSNIVWGINPQGGTHVWCTLSDGNIVDACNGYFNITPAQMAAKGFTW